MAYESSKSSTKNQSLKPGTSAKSSAKLAANSGDTKSGLPTMSGSETTFHECDAIEAELASLKVAYEHYFLGAERMPPTKQHEDLKKRVDRLKTSFVRNTSAKFRVQSIHGKFVTYDRLWQRTMQEIENGTYKRDIAKARRRVEKAKKPAQGRPQEPMELADEDMDEVMPLSASPSKPQPHHLPSVAPVIPAVAPSIPSVAPAIPAVAPLVPAVRPLAPGIPSVAPAIPAVRPLAPGIPSVAPAIPAVRPLAARPPVAAPPRAAAPPAGRAPSASGAGDLSDDKLKTVYDAYVAAKRRNKEDTSKMSYDNIAASLRKQVPELMKQHNAKAVEFKVVIKDGKAVLKAVPK
ncbi:MXAN_5187 C-terminal domain-containing protein [Archangium primigenium]|uniref:MXAN_5187 C-terminal domain-containing protein n=1 Tax=[Archangium] primigenium TaxID=2792470 RepID=UPI001EF82C2A|nr:MXAN_5187 C-terminal domain-containing protein [Archangium primigenium]